MTNISLEPEGALAELAARVEASIMPSARLDEAIWQALYPTASEPVVTPRFTLSLDEAYSLIPNGWLLHFLQEVECANSCETMVWSAELHLRGVGDAVLAVGYHRATALCSAALRAISTTRGSING